MHGRILGWTALAVLVLDQVSKWFVVRHLDLAQIGAIDVWPPYLRFRMAWNRGINFGLLADDAALTRWLLVAVAVGISSWVALWVLRSGQGRGAAIAAGLLVGGAAGNALDRVLYGAVADFLNMSCCGITNPFSFNLADVAVFAGAVGLILMSGGKKPA